MCIHMRAWLRRSVIQCLEDNDPQMKSDEEVMYTVTEEGGRMKASKVTGKNGRPLQVWM